MEDNTEEQEPVSPMGQYFNSSTLSINVIAVLEFEVPIHDLQPFTLLQDVFLPINPRFSSIMVQDISGEKQWRLVDVNLKDHVKIPIFPEGNNTLESNNKYFNDYLSKISVEKLSQNKPLWEVHIINYPTNDAAGIVIFKLHHALGDGYSLMGALLSCLQRSDNHSLPLSFPSLKPSKPQPYTKSFYTTFCWLFSSGFNTIADFGWSLLKSRIISDDKTPIRSGGEGADSHPISISTIAFSIHQIKEIKSKLGVTINDVVTGIIFYGIRLYMEEMNSESKTSQSTALVLLNTRNIEGYQSINDMLNAKSNGPWGNKISFLHVPIPKLIGTKISNPLEFIFEAHNIIKRKKQSLAVAITGTLLDIEAKFRGQERLGKGEFGATIKLLLSDYDVTGSNPENSLSIVKVVGKQIRGTIMKSSAVISNMVGPVQQMSLVYHPVKGLYFTIAGGPESLVVSIMSYMGVLRVTLKTEKDFIDEHKLKSSMQSAFLMILKAATEFS